MKNMKIRAGSVLSCLMMCLSVLLLNPVDSFAGTITESEYNAAVPYATFTQGYDKLEDYVIPDRVETKKISNVVCSDQDVSVYLFVFQNTYDYSYSYYFVSLKPVEVSYDVYCDSYGSGKHVYSSYTENFKISNSYSNDNGFMYYRGGSINLFGSHGTTSYSGGDYLFSASWTDWSDIQDTALNSLCNTMNGIKDPYTVEIKEGFNAEAATYSQDLGYLKNIRIKPLYLQESGEASSFGNPGHRIAFSTTTSSGKKITDEGMNVQYAVSLNVFDKSKNKLGSAMSDCLMLTDNTYVSGDKENSLNAGHLFIFEGSDNFISLLESAKVNVPWYKGISYTQIVWMRPCYCDGKNSYYGAWTKINFDTGETSVDVGTTSDGKINESGTLDNTLSSENIHMETAGSGATVDDALSDATANENLVENLDSAQIAATLEQFKESVMAFVSLLKAVLGFLPPWVTAFLIASIIIMCIMIVKRAIF